MEAEQVNQIAATLAGLKERTGDLREVSFLRCEVGAARGGRARARGPQDLGRSEARAGARQGAGGARRCGRGADAPRCWHTRQQRAFRARARRCRRCDAWRRRRRCWPASKKAWPIWSFGGCSAIRSTRELLHRHPGRLGGAEAQDWAAMLLRMYLRYCERKGYRTELLEETPGRGRRHQERFGEGRGRLCVRLPAHRSRRPPAGAQKPVRFQMPRRHTSFASVFVLSR